jgi:predicted MFS family arabinose efflux permease
MAGPGGHGNLDKRPALRRASPGSLLGLDYNSTILFGFVLLNQFSWGLSNTFTALYLTELGASPAVVGLMIGMTGFLPLGFLLLSGILIERFSPRLLVVAGRTCTTAGAFLYVLAQEWWQLFPALLVIAAGNIAWPVISKIIADASGERDRTRAFTLVYVVAPSIALLVAPTVGGFIADWSSLRIVYLATGIVQVFTVLLLTRIQSPPKPESQPQPARYGELLKLPAVLLVGALQLLVSINLEIGFAFVSKYLNEQFLIDYGTIGRLGSVAALGSIILSLLVARVRFFGQPVNALFFATAICLPSMALLLGDGALWMLLLSYLLMGGWTVAWEMFRPILVDVVPERLQVRAFALSQVLGFASFAVGPLAAGLLYAVSPELPLIVGAAVSLPALAAIVLVWRALQRLRQETLLALTPLAAAREVDPRPE